MFNFSSRPGGKRMSRRDALTLVALLTCGCLPGFWSSPGPLADEPEERGTSEQVAVVLCYPVNTEDTRLYDNWGAGQTPSLEFVGCARECEHKLRKCVFRERPPSASEARYIGVCNGRHAGPPCRLGGRVQDDR